MRKILLIGLNIFLLGFCIVGFSAQEDKNLKKDKVINEENLLHEDDLATVNHLIETTKQNLAIEEQLAKLIKEFRDARQSFRQNPNDKNVATTVIKDAYEIKEMIKENNLAHFFSQDFLSDIDVISKMVNKQTALKRPQ